MGYTHYWNNQTVHNQNFTHDEMVQLKKVLNHWHGQKIICFECDEVLLPYDLTNTVIRFNGLSDDGHETFYFDLTDGSNQPVSWFCKTNRKPYDQCVCEILILLREFLGWRLEVTSDGDMFGDHPKWFDLEWKPAWVRLKEEGFVITWADPLAEKKDEETEEEKTFKVAAQWMMGAEIETTANTLGEAIAKVEDIGECVPQDGFYIDDSFEVNQQITEDLNEKD